MVTRTKLKSKRWCVLFGFKRNNHSETGCLAFRTQDEIKANPKLGIYKIVDNAALAKHFPCENYDDVSGFATPEKWLEFFSSEPELKEWKFHLVKRTSTNETINKNISKNTTNKDNTTCG
jgi:hypothetical protein